MAKFNKGDWVEITPNPDNSWHEWTETHDEFCGAIGQIINVDEDHRSQFEDTDRIQIIVVDFKEEKNKAGFKRYWLWFLKRHVVHSTKEEAEKKQELRRQGSELQQWEATRKRIVNDSLRDVFVPPSQRKKEVPAEVDIWEEDTDPVIPLPGSINKGDDGVIELPDDEDLDDWFSQYGP